MWWTSAPFLVGSLATAIQVVIGMRLLLRDARQDHVAIIAHLFLANGIITALWAASREGLLSAFGPPGAVAAIVDGGTNLLLLALALTYPTPIRGLPRGHAWWSAPIITMGIAVGADWWTGGLQAARHGPLTAPEALAAYALFDLALPLLLLRWTWLWFHGHGGARRIQFALLFGAFGMRAVHMAVLVPAVELQKLDNGRATTLPATVVLVTVGLVTLVAMALALARLGSQMSHLPFKARPWHALVLACLCFGALEGALNVPHVYLSNVGWWAALTLRADVLIVRPILVWLALPAAHTGTDGHLQAGAAATWSGAVAAVGAAGIMAQLTRGALQWPAIVVAAALAGWLAWLTIQRRLPRDAALWTREQEAADERAIDLLLPHSDLHEARHRLRGGTITGPPHIRRTLAAVRARRYTQPIVGDARRSGAG